MLQLGSTNVTTFRFLQHSKTLKKYIFQFHFIKPQSIFFPYRPRLGLWISLLNNMLHSDFWKGRRLNIKIITGWCLLWHFFGNILNSDQDWPIFRKCTVYLIYACPRCLFINILDEWILFFFNILQWADSAEIRHNQYSTFKISGLAVSVLMRPVVSGNFFKLFFLIHYF